MSRYLYILSFLFSVAAITCVYLAQPLAAQLMGLGAWTFGMLGMKNVTRGIDLFAFTISTFTFFYVMDPAHYGLPFFALCVAGMLFVYLPRVLFLTEIGFLRFIGMDVLGGMVVLAGYIMANVKGELGWQGWAIPAFPVLYTVFKTMGAFLDYKAIKPLAGKAYKVGVEKEAPDFTLPDHDGKMVTLSDYRGKNAVLMIFVRGDWCPTCHITLRSYEKNRQKFQDNNVTVMSIGPDPVGVNHEMVKKLGVKFHILADETGEIAMTYGIQTQDNNPMTKFEKGIPLPASFLVDPRGLVRFTSRADRPGEIFNPEDIFPILERIAAIPA